MRPLIFFLLGAVILLLMAQSQPDDYAGPGDRLTVDHGIGAHTDAESTITAKAAAKTSDTQVMLYDGTDWDAGTPTWANDFTSKTFFLDEPTRNATTQIGGSLSLLQAAQDIDSGNSLVATSGISKIFFSVTDTTTPGRVVFTGTKVDRNTGATTATYRDTIDVTTVTLDSTTTDSNGNNQWSFTTGYITSVWYKGLIVVTKHGSDSTDITADFYQVMFDQENDQEEFDAETIDITCTVTNGNADFSAHWYYVDVLTPNADIKPITSIVETNATFTADTWYRLRRGNLDYTLAGARDGWFLDCYFGPGPATTYFEDVTIVLWTEVKP